MTDRAALESELASLEAANAAATKWGAAVGARSERIKEIKSKLSQMDAAAKAADPREAAIEAAIATARHHYFDERLTFNGAIIAALAAYDHARSGAAVGEETTLAGCPIGLFLSANGELCLKTEYRNEGRIDAFIVSSGEFFWGAAPQTIANQRKQRVRPVTFPPPAPAVGLPPIDDAAHTPDVIASLQTRAMAPPAPAAPAPDVVGNCVCKICRDNHAAEAAPTPDVLGETQRTICDWVEQTFGQARSNARVASRANEEMAELLRALTEDDSHPKAVEEAADIVIILYRLAERMGADLHHEIERKMKVNRARKWAVSNGHGYHVKAAAKAAGKEGE